MLDSDTRNIYCHFFATIFCLAIISFAIIPIKIIKDAKDNASTEISAVYEDGNGLQESAAQETVYEKPIEQELTDQEEQDLASSEVKEVDETELKSDENYPARSIARGILYTFFIISAITYLICSAVDKYNGVFFSSPTSTDFIWSVCDDFFLRKKIRKLKLRKLFRFQEKGSSECADNENLYEFSLLKIRVYDRLNSLSKEENQLYQILRYFASECEAIHTVEYALAITKYLYDEAPCYLGRKNYLNNMRSVRKRLLNVLFLYIGTVLSEQGTEWLEAHQEDIEETIRSGNLPIQVDGFDILIDYSYATPESYSYSATNKDLDQKPGVAKNEKPETIPEECILLLELIVDEVSQTIKLLKNEEVIRQMTMSKKLLIRIKNCFVNGEIPMESAKKLTKYYLPVYEKLLRTYCSVQDQYCDVDVDNAKLLLKEIEVAVPVINNVLDKYLNENLQKKVWDIQSDISVLETMSKQDGYM